MAREFLDWSDWILNKNAEVRKEEMEKNQELVGRLKAMRDSAPKGKDMGHAANLRSAQAKLARIKDTVAAQTRATAATAPPKGDTKPVHLPEKFRVATAGGKGPGVGVTPKPIVKPLMGVPGRKA